MSPYGRVLDSKRKEIRVLILQPANSELPVQCSTETVSLLDHPQYEALSYVWGDASITQIIYFDGSPFPVTKNLAVALHHLRLPEKPRKIWIDALCINQKNTQERNDQVQMMGDIYRNANPVLIWLGEADKEIDEGFELVLAAGKETDIPEDSERKLIAFYINLVERHWFNRLWTVQELALANRDPLIGCGFKWTTWSVLFRVWQRVALNQFREMGMTIPTQNTKESADNEESEVRPNGIKIDLLNNLRTAVHNNGGETLRNLLLNTVSSNATEPKDRIYALRGMMLPNDREGIRVDYDRSLGIVYAEAVSQLFQKTNGPFFLSGVELAGPANSDSSYPSWVPTFGSKSLLSPTRLHPPGIGVSGAGSNCENGVVDEDLKTLRVRGMYIDHILEKCEFGDEDNYLSRLGKVDILASKARELAASTRGFRSYLSAFKCKEPVWRTLVANKKYSGGTREPAPESYEQMYESLLRDQHGHYLDGDEDFTREYKLALMNTLQSNCFFITATGFYGIGLKSVRKGDQLAIWFGAPAPFVLRPHATDHGEDSAVYSALGIAYMAGIMDGEMVDEVYCEDLEDDITFVVQ
ncbi:HET-domain-containing protein [Lojkania enalia]|uniref:HET-domain-containing protein n=1 Tax=Lojkania enalia TaxID=147567 RepID=A0A9P4N2L0_9PLEO|nr:HET-domain-containing protein [Didymosphaeria enalia]